MEREQRSRTATTRASRDELKELERQAKEALKAIVIPPYIPPTAEELARRQELGRRIDAFREAVGVLPFKIVDLIREGREELE